jgi:hypothetical protein
MLTVIEMKFEHMQSDSNVYDIFVTVPVYCCTLIILCVGVIVSSNIFPLQEVEYVFILAIFHDTEGFRSSLATLQGIDIFLLHYVLQKLILF